ncbi:unnamed protein product [Acanthoscelides obtectus]|uniref:Uncharacterized protein n=1 Tax=Acanthoscelides obtectus TaxID=200917 RepID=A0A9P0M3U5_ACAOB|nr:unnamed protein product [Acanthoscelides obtectus]CAK1678097.1 hypothetical protein AOBTE_LOCUS31752 [Acanthoscelides obtectus]
MKSHRLTMESKILTYLWIINGYQILHTLRKILKRMC